MATRKHPNRKGRRTCKAGGIYKYLPFTKARKDYLKKLKDEKVSKIETTNQDNEESLYDRNKYTNYTQIKQKNKRTIPINKETRQQIKNYKNLTSYYGY